MNGRYIESRQPEPALEAAVLLHAVAWEASLADAVLGNGVTLARTAASPVGRLYRDLCAETGIDDAEPFDYEVHAVLRETDDTPSLTSYRGPHALVNRLCNVVAVVTGSAVGMYRVLWTQNGFRTATRTELVHASDNLFLEPDDYPRVADDLISDLRVAWGSCRTANDRVTRALASFFHAWRAAEWDQLCLNLGIAMRTLLAGDGGDASSPEIAHHAACLLSGPGDQRQVLCTSFDHLLALQTEIARGDRIESDRLSDEAGRGFPLVSQLLRAVLLNRPLANMLGNDERRAELFRDLTESGEV